MIRWFSQHPVAANLLMGFLLISGVFGLQTVSQTVFPEFDLEVVQVDVTYPGASPEEIEESIIEPIEQAVIAIDGVDAVTATATDALGVVSVEFQRGVDIAQALDEVKAEVDRITVFPEGAEEPIVVQSSNRARVAEIAIVGDLGERELRELAFELKDELQFLPEISSVEVTRTRDYEVSIEVDQDSLRAFGLSLTDVSAAIARESLELPAGDIRTSGEQIGVRTLGRNLTEDDFEDIIVSSTAEGVVYLRDVATVVDGFAERTFEARFDGKPVVFLQLFRVGEERVIDVVSTAQHYLDTEVIPSLPPSVELIMWRNDSAELATRLDIIVKNAIIGLALVLLALTLFLDLRLAFWVAAGIGVAFTATFAIMPFFGISINQLSMFGFILAIGIVVDDAIVAGENIFSEGERGMPPEQAAVKGASRVASPVIFAVATTAVAFFPLLTVPGTLGKFLGDVPAIVIIILALSLIESLLILPRHLSHIHVTEVPKNVLFRVTGSIRARVDKGLQWFINNPLESGLTFATRRWGTTLAGALSILIVTLGVLTGGYVRVNFFPVIEGQFVTATVTLPEGASLSRTQAVTEEVERIGREIIAPYSEAEGFDILQHVFRIEGGVDGQPSPNGGAITIAGTNEASVVMRLAPPEARLVESREVEQVWREALAPLESLARVSVSSDLVSLGFPVQLELTAPDDLTLLQGIDRIETALNEIEGVIDIQNDFDSGKRELKISLKDEALRYGLSLQSVANQVRAAFFGDEALRVQRGRDEVRVYVRLPAEERQFLSDLGDLRIATPSGAFVPLFQVASVEEGPSPSAINRRNGRRVITVSAGVQIDQVTGGEVTTILNEDVLPPLTQELPGLSVRYAGEQEEIGEVQETLGRNFMIALFGIFVLLAIPFRSYMQPLIVMMAIPFGLVGAVLAHLILDLPLGLLSIFGIVGLSGVIINGALVQVDFANEMRENGMNPKRAWVEAGKERFRPIFLTALTTFLGMAPLILEQSVNAQFLIPMAASIAFGVVIGTFIQMLIVPALGSMLDDILGDRAPHLPKKETPAVRGGEPALGE